MPAGPLGRWLGYWLGYWGIVVIIVCDVLAVPYTLDGLNTSSFIYSINNSRSCSLSVSLSLSFTLLFYLLSVFFFFRVRVWPHCSPLSWDLQFPHSWTKQNTLSISRFNSFSSVSSVQFRSSSTDSVTVCPHPPPCRVHMYHTADSVTAPIHHCAVSTGAVYVRDWTVLDVGHVRLERVSRPTARH